MRGGGSDRPCSVNREQIPPDKTGNKTGERYRANKWVVDCSVDTGGKTGKYLGRQTKSKNM